MKRTLSPPENVAGASRIGWQGQVRRRLDRRGTRWLLAALGSTWLSVALREPVWVDRRRDGVWLHHYRGTVIPHEHLLDAESLREFAGWVLETLMHDYTPQLGDVIVDIGAGRGSQTLVFSRLVGPRGRVIALEAHPSTFEWLQRLCRLNALTNVTALQVAASAADGKIFITDTEDWQGNTVVSAENGGRTVPARRLDTIARDLGIDEVDLLTMNIEGAERLAIEGMTWLIDRTRHVCISCHDFIADRGGPSDMRTKSRVREFLDEHGFRVMSRTAPEAWARDYVYGVRAGAESDRAHPRDPLP